MPLAESLTGKVIAEIVKQAGKKSWSAVNRKEKALRILDAVGLKPGAPEDSFDSVYAYTLVEFGVEKPEPVLNFFRHEDIRNAYITAFRENDRSILAHEAAGFIEWNRIGDDLKEQGLDPRLEFASFTLVFNTMIDRTRSPYETRMEIKIDQIIQMVTEGDLSQIRAKTIEMAQGHPAKQLKLWFKSLGYSFGNHDVKGDGFWEWIIKIPARRGLDTILVRFIDRQAEIQDIEHVQSVRAEHEADEAWLVAARRKAVSACRLADDDDKIFCYTLDELLEERADFSRYFDWLKGYVKERCIDSDYVPLACSRDLYDESSGEKIGEERYGEAEGWIEGYIGRWLEDPCKEHISILGEFGTGKTWFAHHYAYRMMKKYAEAKENGLARPRLPLVVHLRDYAKALKFESLFSDFFFRKHEIPLPGYSAFEQLNRMGRLLLIFDGFDEMADKLDRQKMINNFWELARVVVPGAKAILTCRTEHFPNAREGKKLLNAELKASTANLTGDPPQFEVLSLNRFEEPQIRAALSKRTHPEMVEYIMSHPELLDLAARPLMLEFILEALPDIESGKPVDLARVYLYAIQKKLERDFKKNSTFTSTADKFYFMCELSWEMLTKEKMSLNYRLFPDTLRNVFGAVIAEEKDLDHWQYDMMGNSLLIRNDDGDYSPAHRSMLEFFVAYASLARLGMLPDDFTAPARNQSNIDHALGPRDYTWSAYFRREIDENSDVRMIAPLRRLIPEDTDAVLAALGEMGDAVLRFVHEITNVAEMRSRFHAFLAGILDEFKAGGRDVEGQAGIYSAVERLRVLSQMWEEKAGEGDAIRKTWTDYLVNEAVQVQDKVTREVVRMEIGEREGAVIEMVRLPPGSFLMGDQYDGPVHQVTISKPFLIAATPVTQALYEAMTGENPSRFSGGQRPAEKVSWLDAVNFCNLLSQQMGLEPAYRVNGENVEWITASPGFRLPTEAEWEYACRAGTSSAFSCGDLESALDSVAWYDNNSEGETHRVKGKRPNAWGLYDMHGNVWELVWDAYKKYPVRPSIDPAVSSGKGAGRVMRGGGWNDGARYCRSAIRGRVKPGNRYGDVGFRLSRSVALDP